MTADFTRNVLQRALKQIVASFPVYRTYIDMDGAQDDADRRDLDWAMAQARRGIPTSTRRFSTSYKLLSGELVAKPNGLSVAPPCFASP